MFKERISKTTSEIKSFSVESKDKTMAAIKESMVKIDIEMTDLDEWSKEKWNTLSDASKKKYNNSVVLLKEQQKKVTDWFAKLENSPEKSWEEIKKHFSEAYSSMAQTFNDAKNNIRSYY